MRVGLRLCFAAMAALPVMPAAVADGGFKWQAVGAQAYARACGACHQPNGQGLADTFPALAGHAPTILARPNGRDYLVRLVLYGLAGPITANEKPFNGAMPAWGKTLNDEQLAGVLDYVLYSWGNDKALPAGFEPFAPGDITAARGTAMTAAEVYELRRQ